MKKIYLSLMTIAAMMFMACGGGNKSNEAVEAEGEQTEESASAEQAAESAKPEQKAEAKKWYEQDFMLTYKEYIMGKSITRTYARKGNVLVGQAEGNARPRRRRASLPSTRASRVILKARWVTMCLERCRKSTTRTVR